MKLLLTSLFFLFTALNATTTITLTDEEQIWLADHNTSIFGVSKALPPMLMIDKSGKKIGMIVDLFDAINRISGMNMRLKVYDTWKEVATAAIKGQVDGISFGTPDKEWERYFIFSSKLAESSVIIYTRVDYPTIQNGLYDFVGKKVACRYESKICNKPLDAIQGIEKVGYHFDEEAAKMLIDREVDAILAVPTFEYWRMTNSILLIKAAQIAENTKRDVVVLIRKDWKIFKDILDKAIDALKQDEYLRIVSKWQLGTLETIAGKEEKEKLFFKPEEMEYITKTDQLTYCFSPEWRPYDYLENGEHKGILSDHLKTLERKIGIQFIPYISKNLGELLENAKEGKCQFVSGLIHTKEREAFLDFTTPYFYISNVLVAKADQSFVNNIEELAGKSIGIVKNSVIGKQIKALYPAIDFVYADTSKELESLLKKENVYAIVTQLELSTIMIKENGHNYKVIAKLDETIPVSLATNKKAPILKPIFQRALDAISVAESNEISRRWNSVTIKEEFDSSKLWRIIIVFSVLFLFVLYWVLLLNREIQKRKKTEQELERLNDSLQKRIDDEVEISRQKDQLMLMQAKNAAMGEMISAIAHQWRQPLNALSLVIQNIKRMHEKGRLSDENIEMTTVKGRRLVMQMSHTIDEFRSFFKPDKKVVEYVLKEEVLKALELISPLLKHNLIYAELTESTDMVLRGYPNELSQCLLNIIQNAKDAIVEKNHDGKRWIKVALREDEFSGVIEISDNGGGIDEEILPKVFDPYFTTKTFAQGTGIGLYMTKTIIEGHMKGKIEVINENEGAKFRISLPKNISLDNL